MTPLWLALSVAWARPDTRPLDTSDSQSEALEIDVETLNVYGLPPPVAPVRPARLHRLSERVQLKGPRPKLVGLQEVWRGARRFLRPDEKIQLAPLADGDSGLGLRTTMDVRDLELHYFARASGFDILKRKGFLVATVDPGGEPLRVVVTHLQAGLGWRARAVRTGQITEMLDFLAGEELPVVLMGDLNLHIDEGDALVEAGFQDCALAGGADLPTHREGRLDRVYVRDGHRMMLQVLASWVEPLGDATDHQLFGTRLQMRPLIP